MTTIKSEPHRLSETLFDVVVVGGGIYGACVAWDAVLRGLRVALIERGRFGQANSTNSLRFIHGGLRYLQEGNIKLARRMARERETWLRILPDLVRPLPVLLPLCNSPKFNPITMGLALKLNDGVAYDSVLPKGKIISAADTIKALPTLPSPPTAGAMWHDAQMVDAEAITLAFLRAAVARGAVISEGVTMHGRTNMTVHAHDADGNDIAIHGRTIVHCLGAHQPGLSLSLAINLVVPRLWETYAAGLQSADGQMLFFAPAQAHTLIGTYHALWPHLPDPAHPAIAVHIGRFLTQVNSVGVVRLTAADIIAVNRGFLPIAPHSTAVRLLREGTVHESAPQVFDITSVKYTTARWLAEQAIDQVCARLQLPRRCETERVVVTW